MTLLALVALVTLISVGTWLLLDDDMVQIALGALLLGHGALLLLLAPRPAGAPPLLGEGGTIPTGVGDPLPQALGLTAIVISFGVTALLLGMASRFLDRGGDGTADDAEIDDEQVTGAPGPIEGHQGLADPDGAQTDPRDDPRDLEEARP